MTLQELQQQEQVIANQILVLRGQLYGLELELSKVRYAIEAVKPGPVDKVE